MNPQQIVKDAQTKFQNALAHFEEELKKIRTGRAHPSMLDGVVVEAYGTSMPLIQVASISTPEPQLIQISPFDLNNVQAISAAIRNNQSLGMNPMDDGKVVRVPVPPLTEERRREYAKLVGTKQEDCMVALRNVRHDALKDIKEHASGEDESKRLEKQIDEEMAKVKSQAEAMTKAKEQEILTV